MSFLKHDCSQEQLASEWGLHNHASAELMLKRARRMKGVAFVHRLVLLVLQLIKNWLFLYLYCF